MSTMNSSEFQAVVLSKITEAGKLDRESTKKVMAAVVAKLQEGYAGALARMAPTDAEKTPEMSIERWAKIFIFTVLDVCGRHNRTQAQVLAALDAVLAA